MRGTGEAAFAGPHQGPNDATPAQAAGRLDDRAIIDPVDLGEGFGDFEQALILHGLPPLLHDSQDRPGILSPDSRQAL